MHHIRSVAVEGFWGTHDFAISIDPEVTFFIGQNGTGKTTLINLIAAALKGDYRTLDRIEFRKITITLSKNNQKNAPTIVVKKTVKKGTPFEPIDYLISSGRDGQKDIKFSLDEAEEQYYLRRLHAESRYLDYYRRMQTGLNASLEELVFVDWLSIHRGAQIDASREARSYESTVDQKLESLSNEMVRYFASLSASKDAEIRDFQESLFISLVEQNTSGFDPFDRSRLEKIDFYRESLSSIFSELHVSQDTTRLIKSFIERAEFIKRKFSEEGNNIQMMVADAIYLYGLQRIEEIVKRWESLQDRLKSIFLQRDLFADIANSMFKRKTMSITSSNELSFRSRSGKDLKAEMLSSGEKQLLILMSEALLQRRQPAILIADEPELSLHVVWQEQLVRNLRALNPEAQIIVATHSPDIVGPLYNKTVDMESIIR